MSIIFAEVIFTQVMRSALFPTAYIDLVISMLLLLLLLLMMMMMMMMMIMMITWVGALASVTSMLLMVWPSFGAMVSATIMFTHSGQFQISVGNLTIIGSDNGLSPGRRQAIIWTNVGILLIGPLGTNFNEMLTEIHTFHSRKSIWKCCLENGVHFVSASMCLHIEAETKRTTFSRQHFQIEFLVRKCMNFDWNFIYVCSQGSN